jgi:WXG100 family type VII secretion target
MSMRTGPQGATGGSAQLQTDLGTMASSAQSVRDSADTIHQKLMNLRTQIETLKGSWKSASATAYCDQQMVDWDLRAGNVRDALYDIADGLTGTHKSYNTMEEDNLQGVKQATQGLL